MCWRFGFRILRLSFFLILNTKLRLPLSLSTRFSHETLTPQGFWIFYSLYDAALAYSKRIQHLVVYKGYQGCKWIPFSD
ncbi:hypothetical protein SASPL_105572 [Salvia splendens]|uniref:Secreted protein n=1 Tax=Salvia splendens TaxID=180675 RepID=A0A8X8YQQ1_SALSN|nr:hypothetical protein SASPL_105572 [Salvia splendens]